MIVTRRPLFYGLCLLVGALLFGIAGLNHPILSGDGAAQLATIAKTGGWRVIHWALLFGLAFMYAGVIGVALSHNDTPGATPGRAAVRMGAFAFSIWSLNILFMVGAGYQLADAYTASDAGLTGTHGVFIYDMLHPVGLAAERLATFMLGLVAYMFGWTIRNGGIWPKRSEEHTSELQSPCNLVCRLLLEKKKIMIWLEAKAHRTSPRTSQRGNWRT